MSRVGKNPVSLVDGVTAEINGQTIKVKGPNGELSFEVHRLVTVAHDNDNNTIVFTPVDDSNKARANWGTARSRVQNMVVGVKDGYKIELQLVGTGYRAKVNGNFLDLELGYSHHIKFAIPGEVKIETPSQTEIIVSGNDKQLVGQIAAEIRSYRKPEPYKGKGVHRKGEFNRRKEGKKK